MTTTSFHFRIEYEDSEDSDAFEDEDDGPALVCSCTLGGPTVVIEAKTDEVEEAKEGKGGHEKEAGVANQVQDQDQGPFQEEDGEGSDAKVVRFEVAEHWFLCHQLILTL